MISIEHVGIASKNTVELKDWYVRLFNLKVVYDNKKEIPTFFLKIGNESMIEIHPAKNEINYDTIDKTYQGVRHICFYTDDIENENENLIENNVTIINPLNDNKKGVKTVWFKDIEGNILHFIEREEKLI